MRLPQSQSVVRDESVYHFVTPGSGLYTRPTSFRRRNDPITYLCIFVLRHSFFSLPDDPRLHTPEQEVELIEWNADALRETHEASLY